MAPQNAIGLVSDEINLECEATDALTWLLDNGGITGADCTDLNPPFSTAAGSTATDCTLVMQGQHGPFTCLDSNDVNAEQPDNAEAVVIIIGQ